VRRRGKAATSISSSAKASRAHADGFDCEHAHRAGAAVGGQLIQIKGLIAV